MGRCWNGSVSYYPCSPYCILQVTFLKKEYLTDIFSPVIVLIAAEILVAAVNIVVDLYAGVD